MFQRFKDASNLVGNFVDQLADEQNRLRAQQAPSPSNSARRPPPRTRATAPAGQKEKTVGSNNAEPGVSLVGPDPDPSSFDPATVEEEREKEKEKETEFTDQDAGLKVPGAIPEEQSHSETKEDGTTTAAAGADFTPPVPRNSGELQHQSNDVRPFQASPDPPKAAAELPSDVQAKLRKLDKLEGKYQELLKAYRRAHARNSAIEPFEACLRENTPLTSITEPSALIEYLNQLNTKVDMVMTELKSVSSEKDDLKKKLQQADENLKAAYEEVTQLKEHTTETEASKSSAAKTSKVASEGENEEVFSYDNEVPRLQSELQQRSQQIDKLQSENEGLKQELEVARESAEQMMRDMESAKGELASMHATHGQARNERDEKCVGLEGLVVELKSKLETVETDLQMSRTSQGNMAVLHSQLEVSQKELESLRDTQKSADENHRRRAQITDALVLELKAQLQTAEAELVSTTKKYEDGYAQLQALLEAKLVETQVHHVDEGPEEPLVQEPQDASSKKKKNKKKKKAGAAHDISSVNGSGSTRRNGSMQTIATTLPSSLATRNVDAQLQEKDATIDQLQKRLKEQDDLIEEIESLKDELINVGQEHVEAKDKLVHLQNEKAELEKKVCLLESEIAELRENNSKSEGNEQMLASLQVELADTEAKTQGLEAERTKLEAKVKTMEQDIATRQKFQATNKASSDEVQKKLEADFADLRIKSRSLQTDLSAAESLAATRFKEMTNLRDMLQKAQSELTVLRTEVIGLRASRDELSVKARDLRKLELREENMKSEIDSLKTDVSAKDSDIKNLNQKINQETSQRLGLEESNRKSQRDLQRLQTERVETVVARDGLSKDFERTKGQLDESQTRLQQLERQVEQLNRDTESLRDEISLKTAQHASAETLMSSIRDQATEMATQMKEAKERCESLEEELTDAHRLMSERGREGETMRRLLAEVEGRAETRVKEMRERMELAIQERDRAEDDASSIGRRKARELEDVKSKLREVERDLKYAQEDKSEAQKAELEFRRQKTESDLRIDQSTEEVLEVRKAMSELRDALDEGEKQAREYEMERNELKKSSEDLQHRVEKLQKSNKTLSDDLRSARATRIRPTDSPAQSARSSSESLRPGGRGIMSPISPRSGPGFSAVGHMPTIDYVYLKNVLLQFMEQKDKARQMQLLPVLRLLLHFDSKDEQKWASVIGAK